MPKLMTPRSLARSTFPSASLVRAIPALSIVVLPFTSGSNAPVHAAASSSLSVGTSALVMSLKTTLVLSVSSREDDRRRDGGLRIPRTCPYERVFTGTSVGGRGALPSLFRLAAPAGRCKTQQKRMTVRNIRDNQQGLTANRRGLRLNPRSRGPGPNASSSRSAHIFARSWRGRTSALQRPAPSPIGGGGSSAGLAGSSRRKVRWMSALTRASNAGRRHHSPLSSLVPVSSLSSPTDRCAQDGVRSKGTGVASRSASMSSDVSDEPLM